MTKFMLNLTDLYKYCLSFSFYSKARQDFQLGKCYGKKMIKDLTKISIQANTMCLTKFFYPKYRGHCSLAETANRTETLQRQDATKIFFDGANLMLIS